MAETTPAIGNWGRWGPADERGAANLLDEATSRRGLAAVRLGKSVSLALPIRGATSSYRAQSVPHMPGRPLPQHYMAVDGADYAAGARAPAGGRCIADDALLISAHGTSTHVDALCHMWRGESLYNGHAGAEVRSYGAKRCGIERLGHIVTRGLLIDAPVLKGRPRLQADDRITAADLQRWQRDSGLTIEPGDAVLLRTGWSELFDEDRDAYWAGEPGLSSDGASWLAERDVVLVGADNSAVSALRGDQRAHECLDDDIHMILLWAHGIYLLEMLWLKELAQADVRQFLFMLAPLLIEGGTGSPVNPLAVY